MATFYKLRQEPVRQVSGDHKRILDQVQKAGFTGDIKIYDLGFDSEDSISLVIEGIYEGNACCVAVGYGMNRHNLAIRKTWSRQNPQVMQE